MKTGKPSALRFIEQKPKVASVPLRIPEELKQEATVAAQALDISLNRFIEASIKCYLEELKKELGRDL